MLFICIEIQNAPILILLYSLCLRNLFFKLSKNLQIFNKHMNCCIESEDIAEIFSIILEITSNLNYYFFQNKDIFYVHL